ncbi:hypothetical protein E2C01_013295 [Portunus trituberculatus]|uniref:Uncharacterized protein n=1 Tax=Portunus trituberculatus TaxID=210409 RepID=A0A5B7DGM7_PORTR|nr:hypothetical protein [Portunus trituberculatus]
MYSLQRGDARFRMGMRGNKSAVARLQPTALHDPSNELTTTAFPLLPPPLHVSLLPRRATPRINYPAPCHWPPSLTTSSRSSKSEKRVKRSTSIRRGERARESERHARYE